ncbi:MAG TPA: hypothetical protein VMP08_16700 [Anaerolineae bacterium]|nr:hypothetical protein [Anaerolineae bacterium]
MGNKQVLTGISVTWNDAKHRTVNVKDGPRNKSDIPRSKNNDDEFVPSRIVVDLKLDLGDTKAVEVTLDDVHLQIAYSGTQPTLGWWNGAKWVKFKQVTYAKNVANVTLPSPWPTDPPIGSWP